MVTMRFKTNDLKALLEPLLQRVLEYFRVPALRVLCFFDDENPLCFEPWFGTEYRGFHVPVTGSGGFPPYIEQLFFDSYDGFDNVIYLPGRTCAAEVGTVITFAHELQHFVQHGSGYKVLEANNLLRINLPDFDPASTAKVWNIPHETNAMIVSRRVAEGVLGTEVVSKHAGSSIAAQDDVGYWEYFLSLSPQISFDLLAETIPWVDRYRPQLLTLQQSKVDFSQSDWWR
jgi:hypothetical protein